MSTNNTQNASYFAETELADLGRERFDQDTAAIGDRDDALHREGHVYVRQGRAPAGLEQQVFAWAKFQYETEERDSREELKGDLHGGQLHRQNRAARGELTGPPPVAPRGRGGRGGARGGGSRGQGHDAEPEGLVCGVKENDDTRMSARGKPEELGDELFWDTKIC